MKGKEDKGFPLASNLNKIPDKDSWESCKEEINIIFAYLSQVSKITLYTIFVKNPYAFDIYKPVVQCLIHTGIFRHIISDRRKPSMGRIWCHLLLVKKLVVHTV